MSLIKKREISIAQKRARQATAPQDITAAQASEAKGAEGKWLVFAPGDETAGDRRKVKDAIQDLSEAKDLHIVSDGAWGAHSMLAAVMRHKIQAPGHLYLGSWAISQEPMTWLLRCLDEGMLTSVTALVDSRNQTLRAGIIEGGNLHSKFCAYYTAIHAKVWVMDSGDKTCTCVSSANFSRNRRVETYIMTMSREIADFHRGWILRRWRHLKARDQHHGQ